MHVHVCVHGVCAFTSQMQPEAEKAKSWTLGEEPLCPTEVSTDILTLFLRFTARNDAQ